MSNSSDRELRQRPRVDYRLLNSVGTTEGPVVAAAEADTELVDQVTSSDSELFFSGSNSPEHSFSNSCNELDNTTNFGEQEEDGKSTNNPVGP